MLPEYELIDHSDYPMRVFFVLFHKIVQQTGFRLSEFVVYFRVPSYFDSDFMFLKMIKTLDDLCKAALT